MNPPPLFLNPFRVGRHHPRTAGLRGLQRKGADMDFEGIELAQISEWL